MLEKQRVQRSILNKLLAPASEAIAFGTGPGNLDSSKSLDMTSNVFGVLEAYLHDHSPFATCMEHTVTQLKQPFIWHHRDTNSLPWFCTSCQHLKITWLLKYRRSADKVADYVPSFTGQIVLRRAVSSNAAPNFISALPVEAIGGGDPVVSMSAPSDDLDAKRAYACVPCGDDDAVADESTAKRSMSIKELLTEMESRLHNVSHYPHNPYCEVCKLAHMRQRSYAHKKEREDDEQPRLTGPLQELGVNCLIVSSPSSLMNMVNEGYNDRVSSSGNIACFTIRDHWSRPGYAHASSRRDRDTMYDGMTVCVGPDVEGTPNLIV